MLAAAFRWTPHLKPCVTSSAESVASGSLVDSFARQGVRSDAPPPKWIALASRWRLWPSRPRSAATPAPVDMTVEGHEGRSVTGSGYQGSAIDSDRVDAFPRLVESRCACNDETGPHRLGLIAAPKRRRIASPNLFGARGSTGTCSAGS
jgi:hypothetical protein